MKIQKQNLPDDEFVICGNFVDFLLLELPAIVVVILGIVLEFPDEELGDLD